MDLELLERLAEALEAPPPRGGIDLGPYLDAACEALEWSGTHGAIVGLMGGRSHWEADPPRYGPGADVPEGVTRLVRALATRCTPGGGAGAVAGGRRPAEFVIDTRRRPRAAFHEAYRYSAVLHLERADAVFDALDASFIRHVIASYEWDEFGLRFTDGPETLPGRSAVSDPLAATILERLRLTLLEATWPNGVTGCGGFVQIDGRLRRARVEFRVRRRIDPLLTFD